MAKFLDSTGLAHFWDAFKARLLPSGGTSGQVLAKSSDTNYATGWVTPSGGDTMTWYATSSTTASTTAKVVDCTGFTLKAGAIIGILFSTANTASAPTLNINSTGVIALRIGNTAPSSTTNVLKWSANTMLYVMYDGTYYRLLNAVSRAADNSFEGGGTWYGTCSTAAGTAAKTSGIANFRLTVGALVSLTCSTANTVTSEAVTLNVGSTGAKTIATAQGATSSSVHLTWAANSVLTFMYDGTYWRYLGTSQPPAAVIPSGGTSGQVLAKSSNDDYALGWVDQSGGGGTALTLGWSDVSAAFTGYDGLWESDLHLTSGAGWVVTDGHSVRLSGYLDESIVRTLQIPPAYAPVSANDDMWAGSVNYMDDGSAAGVCYVETFTDSVFTISADVDTGGQAVYSIEWPLATPIGVTVSSIAATNGLLAGDGNGNAIAAHPSSLFVVESHQIIASQSISAGSYQEAQTAVTKAGYYPLGVVGWTTGSTRYGSVYHCYMNRNTIAVGSATVNAGVYNSHTSAHTFSLNVHILWMKAT